MLSIQTAGHESFLSKSSESGGKRQMGKAVGPRTVPSFSLTSWARLTAAPFQHGCGMNEALSLRNASLTDFWQEIDYSFTKCHSMPTTSQVLLWAQKRQSSQMFKQCTWWRYGEREKWTGKENSVWGDAALDRPAGQVSPRCDISKIFDTFHSEKT